MKLQKAMIVLCLAAGSAFANTFQVINVPGASVTEISGMNNTGQVVGEYDNAFGAFGFIYNTLTDQFTLLTGVAYSINDSGMVGGDGYTYSNGIYTSQPGGVWGIDNSGQLAVTELGSFFDNEAVRRTPNGVGGYSDAILSIGSDGTYAGGMDNNGDMVGYYQTPNYGAFIWHSNGSSSTFHVPNDNGTTQALGINDEGVIVGSYFDSTVDHHFTGFIYENGQYITDIDPPGSRYTYLTDINDQGTAVGWYIDANNQYHGFIMTDSVPEPSTAGLVWIGLAAMGFGALKIAHRKRKALKKRKLAVRIG
jgi:hypothetical protein